MNFRIFNSTKRKAKSCCRSCINRKTPLFVVFGVFLFSMSTYVEIKLFIPKISNIVSDAQRGMQRLDLREANEGFMDSEENEPRSVTKRGGGSNENQKHKRFVSTGTTDSRAKRKRFFDMFRRNKTAYKPVNQRMKKKSVDVRNNVNAVTTESNHTAARKMSEVSDKSRTQHDSTKCKFTSHLYFPFCMEKVNYLRIFWKYDECLRQTVDGSDCSIYNFLTKVEPYCVGNRELYTPRRSEVAHKNIHLPGLMKLLSDNAYKWLRGRVSFLWPSWVEGANKFSPRNPEYIKKRVIVFVGAENKWLFDWAGHGGPLGELIQWSDLITGLYILGHDVTITGNISEIVNILNITQSRCANREHKAAIDIIYTDINGVISMMNVLGTGKLAKYKCMFRVLDSFGTYPELNFPKYPEQIPGGRSFWGDLNLLITQFLTLYPHTHDNRFLGFVIPNVTKGSLPLTRSTNNRAMLYAKQASFIKKREPYLKIISEYFDIHATCINDALLPSYITNHGPVSGEKVNELLSESKLFIGLGFPYEGPGPLEAMANGVVYLQPRFDPPLNKLNDKFFAGKPTLRKLTSQNPYMEVIVGEPYSYTINITDETWLRRTLEKIKSMNRLPNHIPKEFTNIGFLERVHVFTSYINVCNPYSPRWPPLDNLEVLFSLPGESCTDACISKGLVCENTYFDVLNSPRVIEGYRVTCRKSVTMMVLHAPSVNLPTMTCYTQAHPQLFSCMAAERNNIRLCPCRDYEVEQTAICKNCF